MNRRSFLNRVTTAAVAMAAAPIILRETISAQMPVVIHEPEAGTIVGATDCGWGHADNAPSSFYDFILWQSGKPYVTAKVLRDSHKAAFEFAKRVPFSDLE